MSANDAKPGTVPAPTPGRARATRLRRLALAVVSTLVTLFVLDAAFPLLVPRLPPRTYAFLPGDLAFLAQSSKAGLDPHDWIAVAGDSHAAGLGDALLEQMGRFAPRYGIAHVLHEALGRDVVTFGEPGLGAAAAWGKLPSRVAGAVKHPRHAVEPPTGVLLVFYEGNDLDDDHRHPAKGVYYPPPRVPAPPFFTHALGFLPFAYRALTSHKAGTEFFTGGLDLLLESPAPGPGGDGRTNLIEGRALPPSLQGPALQLDDATLEPLFGRLSTSLAAVRRALPDATVVVAYLPSPLATYRLVSPTVTVERYHAGPVEFPSEVVPVRSAWLSERVRTIAAEGGATFVDTGPALRAAAEQRFVHGPRDFGHPNMAGYEVIGREIAAAFPRR